jgi:hypothetical protein
MVAAAVVTGAALAVAGHAVAQQQNFDNVQIDTVKVRDNVYMLVGAGGNTTVPSPATKAFWWWTRSSRRSAPRSSPPSGPSARGGRSATWSAPTCTATTSAATRPISKAGRTRAGGNVVGDLGAGATGQAVILAHENVLNRLSAPPAAGQQAVPFALWPT